MPAKIYIPQATPELPDPPIRKASGEVKALAAVMMIGALAALVWAWKGK